MVSLADLSRSAPTFGTPKRPLWRGDAQSSPRLVRRPTLFYTYVRCIECHVVWILKMGWRNRIQDGKDLRTGLRERR